MTTAYITVTLIAIAANGFSGIAALLHLKPILPGMAKAGVPISWLTFPIGTLKTAGALGLAAGLAFRPLGVAAAIGLVLFFVRDIHAHPCQRLQPAVLPRQWVPCAQRRRPCRRAASQQPQRNCHPVELTRHNNLRNTMTTPQDFELDAMTGTVANLTGGVIVD